MAVTTQYETVIGIEVHAQLRTESKMFCSCPTRRRPGEPDEPNTRVCPVCLGLPGTLPVINRRAVELVMLTGLALECHVETDAVRFERKNYFYPDLPKGYQISQYALPLTQQRPPGGAGAGGGGEVTIGITRAHLEEDTARMQHAGRGYSVVDFNRAGVPLMEIVTEPDIRSPAQARAYGETLRELLRAIGAINADMEAGACGSRATSACGRWAPAAFGTKVEVKNLNSFRSLERALEFEVARHAEALERGEPLVQETRGWDEDARPHDRPALQGGGERLPLLPRARPAAAATVRGVGGRAARAAAGAAGRSAGPVHGWAWPVGVRRRRPDRGRRPGRYFDAVVGGRDRGQERPPTGSRASSAACSTSTPPLGCAPIAVALRPRAWPS